MKEGKQKRQHKWISHSSQTRASLHVPLCLNEQQIFRRTWILSQFSKSDTANLSPTWPLPLQGGHTTPAFPILLSHSLFTALMFWYSPPSSSLFTASTSPNSPNGLSKCRDQLHLSQVFSISRLRLSLVFSHEPRKVPFSTQCCLQHQLQPAWTCYTPVQPPLATGPHLLLF